MKVGFLKVQEKGQEQGKKYKELVQGQEKVLEQVQRTSTRTVLYF